MRNTTIIRITGILVLVGIVVGSVCQKENTVLAIEATQSFSEDITVDPYDQGTPSESQDADKLAIPVIKTIDSNKSNTLSICFVKIKSPVKYQVVCATNFLCTKGKKTIVSKSNKVKFKKLKKKTYYIRARAFRVKNGTKVYSDWSNILRYRVKRIVM